MDLVEPYGSGCNNIIRKSLVKNKSRIKEILSVIFNIVTVYIGMTYACLNSSYPTSP